MSQCRRIAIGARRPKRSLQHFSIGDDRMPKAVYHAYGYVKKACALVNHEPLPLR